MKLINVGFGNIVSASKIVAIVSPESAPIKRIIQEARDRGVLIDATYGRRTRAVIVTEVITLFFQRFSLKPLPRAYRKRQRANSGHGSQS